LGCSWGGFTHTCAGMGGGGEMGHGIQEVECM
jgi:hypothetical protein